MRRLEELDSLRGLAALSVVLFHFETNWLDIAVPSLDPHKLKTIELLLAPVTAGREAVLLFFILSGFVLSLPAIESRAQRYPVFLVRRIFRIYVPYLAAMVLAVLGTAWFYLTPIQWRLVGQHALLLGQFDTGAYNTPIWSLVYEMRISLVFPFLCAVALLLKPAQSLIAAVGLSAVAMVAKSAIPALAGEMPAIDTLHYAGLFVLGIYLARERGRIAELFSGISREVRIAVALLSAFLYIYGGTIWLEMMRKATGHGMAVSADWVTSMGAAGLMVVSLNSARLKRILLWRPVLNLGKISYSLYLLHFPICLFLVTGLHGKVAMPVVFAICMVGALCASWAFYRVVEAPSVRWGRAVSLRV